MRSLHLLCCALNIIPIDELTWFLFLLYVFRHHLLRSHVVIDATSGKEYFFANKSSISDMAKVILSTKEVSNRKRHDNFQYLLLHMLFAICPYSSGSIYNQVSTALSQFRAILIFTITNTSDQHTVDLFQDLAPYMNIFNVKQNHCDTSLLLIKNKLLNRKSHPNYCHA